MNTKKLVFGILACLTLMAATAAPYATAEDGMETGIKKRSTTPPGNNK